jgi:uncharacterized secreted protein with C-terminal beta-propeller domain
MSDMSKVGRVDPYLPSKSLSEFACFDISDPANPVYLGSFGQDGYYTTSRLMDGILYLISGYSIYDFDSIQEGEPRTYVPTLYGTGSAKAMEAADICILPNPNALSYTVVSSFDVAALARLDQKSILGYTETTYMAYLGLYLAVSEYGEKEVDSWSHQQNPDRVTTFESTTSTRLVKLSLDQGIIDLVAEATVPGTLLNQFSLDEFAGCLRLATTISPSVYDIIDEGPLGKRTEWYSDTPTTNAVFVLGGNLQTLGSIEGLAADERIYSVRFDGKTGYVVTFRQTDPLFAIDLSDPSNPQVKDALKIPGFSSYLHVFGEGRLLGLGMAADENGRTHGMKLSMFDVSDPLDISEKHTLELGDAYSEALYNHKAIFVDVGLGYFGFPAHDGYTLYRYDDQTGFSLAGRLKLEADSAYYAYNLRGIRVGECFYLCSSSGIGVFDLATLDALAQVEFAADTTGAGPTRKL